MTAALRLSTEEIASLAQEAEGWSAQEILRWALDRFHPAIGFASSFGVEDVAVIDILAKLRSDARVFSLDTVFRTRAFGCSWKRSRSECPTFVGGSRSVATWYRSGWKVW